MNVLTLCTLDQMTLCLEERSVTTISKINTVHVEISAEITDLLEKRQRVKRQGAKGGRERLDQGKQRR